jgi:hypothetical protein
MLSKVLPYERIFDQWFTILSRFGAAIIERNSVQKSCIGCGQIGVQNTASTYPQPVNNFRGALTTTCGIK